MPHEEDGLDTLPCL